MAVNREDRNQAIKHQLLGRPNFERLYGDTTRGVHLIHAVLDTEPYRQLGPRTSCTQEAGRDPIPTALTEAGALHVGQREFRMPDGCGKAEYPLAKSQFLITGPPNSAAKTSTASRKFVSVSSASREFTNYLKDPRNMHPALRKSPLREVLQLFRARGQFGFPASMHADACLDLREISYQSWGNVRGHCGAPRSILNRIIGTVAKGH